MSTLFQLLVMNGFTRNWVLYILKYIITVNNISYGLVVIAKNPIYEEFMKKKFPANFTYSDFAPKFTAEFFEPQKWAKLFKQSGAK